MHLHPHSGGSCCSSAALNTACNSQLFASLYHVFPIPDTITTAERIDVAWQLLGQVKDPVTGNAKCANLSTFVKGILTIF